MQKEMSAEESLIKSLKYEAMPNSPIVKMSIEDVMQWHYEERLKWALGKLPDIDYAKECSDIIMSYENGQESYKDRTIKALKGE